MRSRRLLFRPEGRAASELSLVPLPVLSALSLPTVLATPSVRNVLVWMVVAPLLSLVGTLLVGVMTPLLPRLLAPLSPLVLTVFSAVLLSTPVGVLVPLTAIFRSTTLAVLVPSLLAEVLALGFTEILGSARAMLTGLSSLLLVPLQVLLAALCVLVFLVTLPRLVPLAALGSALLSLVASHSGDCVLYRVGDVALVLSSLPSGPLLSEVLPFSFAELLGTAGLVVSLAADLLASILRQRERLLGSLQPSLVALSSPLPVAVLSAVVRVPRHGKLRDGVASNRRSPVLWLDAVALGPLRGSACGLILQGSYWPTTVVKSTSDGPFRKDTD